MESLPATDLDLSADWIATDNEPSDGECLVVFGFRFLCFLVCFLSVTPFPFIGFWACLNDSNLVIVVVFFVFFFCVGVQVLLCVLKRTALNEVWEVKPAVTVELRIVERSVDDLRTAILSGEVNVNERDEDSRTMLMHSIARKDVDMTRMLLQCGASFVTC